MGRIGVILLVLAVFTGLAVLIGVPVGALARAVFRVLLSMRRRIANAARSINGRIQFVEVLIVAATIGILLAIAIPLYNYVSCRQSVARGETVEGCESFVEAKAQVEREKARRARGGAREDSITCARGYVVAHDNDGTSRISCQ